MSSHSLAALYGLLHSPWVGRLGWTLIHSLWQGGLLALAFAALSRRRDTAADTRYLGACATLLLMAVCPALTWLVLRVPTETGGASSTAAGGVGLWDSLPGWAAFLWLAGVGVLSVRVFGGWVRVQRLRRLTAPLPDALHRRAKALARRMGITRRLYVRASSAVQVPTVIGCLRRVVLVPTGLVSGLPPEALEALLAHEFAHVRRHDYLVNFIQTLLETLLFYHPAAWWVSHRIRVEREHCCDDLAAALVGDRVLYARALTALEETRHGTLALAASDGDLLGRVRRLVSGPTPDLPLPLSTAGLSLVLGLWMAAVVWPVTLWSLAPTDTPQERVGPVTASPAGPVSRDPVASLPRPQARPGGVRAAAVAHGPRILVAHVATRRYVRLPIRHRSPEVCRVTVWQSRLVLSPVRVLPTVLVATRMPDAPRAENEPEQSALTAEGSDETEPAPAATVVRYDEAAPAVMVREAATPAMIRLVGLTVQNARLAGALPSPGDGARNDQAKKAAGDPSPEPPGDAVDSPVGPDVPADAAPSKDGPYGSAAPDRTFPDKAIVERMRALQDRMMRLQVQMQALAEQMRRLQDQLQSQMQQFQGEQPRSRRPVRANALPGRDWTAPASPPAPLTPPSDPMMQ